VPSSVWDDYFEVLAEYLESVRIAVAIGRLAAVPPRLACRPSGPLPEEYRARLQSATAAIDSMIGAAERQRDDVIGRLRSIRRRDRPTISRSRLIDCEL
jgi:hypothetical protein